MAKSKKIQVKGIEITVIQDDNKDFISLTDMLRAKDGDFFISDCLGIGTQSSFWEYGNRFTIPILIMANSP